MNDDETFEDFMAGALPELLRFGDDRSAVRRGAYRRDEDARRIRGAVVRHQRDPRRDTAELGGKTPDLGELAVREAILER